jgi:hypothetical protein
LLGETAEGFVNFFSWGSVVDKKGYRKKIRTFPHPQILFRRKGDLKELTATATPRDCNKNTHTHTHTHTHTRMILEGDPKKKEEEKHTNATFP